MLDAAIIYRSSFHFDRMMLDAAIIYRPSLRSDRMMLDAAIILSAIATLKPDDA